MDKIVIDSGVAVKWFVLEPNSAEALRILNEYQAGRLDLLAAVDLIYAEIGQYRLEETAIPRFNNATAAASSKCSGKMSICHCR